MLTLAAPAAIALPAGAPTQTSPASLFATNCASCHGSVANPAPGAANLFQSAQVRARTDEQLLRAIVDGHHGARGFRDKLSDYDSWRVVSFVRTQAGMRTGKPTFVPDPDGLVVDSPKQSVRVEVVTRDLSTPWGLAFLPDGRLLVTERPGRLRIVDHGKLLPQPVSGTPAVWERQDAGLMDVAVHPDYRRNGWIYLTYTDVPPGTPLPGGDSVTPVAQRAPSPPSMTVIIRGKLDRDNRWTATQEIFRAPASLYTPSGSHYGSRLLFDGRGHLFYTIGDRGVFANAQDLGNPLGKIHRVNDDGTVPRDNPFVGRAGAIPTIWTYGHRNPQGLAYDPRSGLLWESEHGPSGGDEINVIEKGRNYGWGLATMGVQAGITQRTAPGTVAPITYYTPSIAPSGLHFYTGRRYPGWTHSLFVAALTGQQLRRIEVSGRRIVSQEPIFEQLGRTRALAIGPDGLMYILLQNPTGVGTGIGLSDPAPGKLIRLVPVPRGARSAR